ncbi:TonB-dependent receptor plug domain-containing protein [uncultured Mucilaginibacter sp.]|uniref:TonB-dependent receptor plug domain-containing protein n=1 Tax=Mucilaginibacter sp. 44-25 TaxID=1895794 RepID=UPI000A5E1649
MKKLVMIICLFASVSAFAQDTVKKAVKSVTIDEDMAKRPEPLYVIDGYKVNSRIVTELKPDHIESMSVLKGASATALYGSEGANGVIIIATKAGTKGTLALIKKDSLANNTFKGALYIIDGVKADKAMLKKLNPDEIESVSVLKDASATAIYGLEGANGVILITTKGGLKKQKLKN